MIEALTQGLSQVYVPAIRASIKWSKRPTTVITRDDWFGHRDPLSGNPQGDKDEWTGWDFALVDAYQTIEDYTDQYGILRWVQDDEQVEILAQRKVHKFDAARIKKTSGKNYKVTAGEYFVPSILSHRKDDNGRPVYQTFREWVKTQIEDSTVDLDEEVY